MRLTYPYQTERLGAVRIYGLQHVFELASGPTTPQGDSALSWGTTVCHVPTPALEAVERRMAVVVPCKDERIKLLEGVLAGIPHECLIILVSNSSQDPIDRFAMERDSVERFCRFNQRPAVIVHQRDPGLGAALRATGMSELVDEEGLVRHGKGEGMIVGIALAYLAGKDYVGFVDADNYVPGSVTEYVTAFAADLHLSSTPFAMVRVSWHSKPKVVDGSIFFQRWGRVSETTNRFLNLLVAYLTGFGTDAIRTSNAGEHAMTMSLALQLRFASGFAVEPYELLELLERFGGMQPAMSPVDAEALRRGIEVFQVETRNPHFHEDRGENHVDDMRYSALAAIYRSPICPHPLRQEILTFIERETGHDPTTMLTPAVTYPRLDSLDWGQLTAKLKHADSLEQLVYPDVETLLVTPELDLF